MTNAPEKLWAMGSMYGEWSYGHCSNEQPKVNDITAPFIFEYIRKDISDAHIEVILMSLQMANTAWDQETSGRKAADARVKELEEVLEVITNRATMSIGYNDDFFNFGWIVKKAREALMESNKLISV
jgi:hypothetical protein